jgi:hypothetical protein
MVWQSLLLGALFHGFGANVADLAAFCLQGIECLIGCAWP